MISIQSINIIIIIIYSESPPSFDGRYGCINYFVECIIDKDGEPGSSLNRGHRYGVEIKLENPVRKSLMVSANG